MTFNLIMKPINIRYCPISFIPVYRTVKGNFPENWGEITSRQLISIARLYKAQISDVDFLASLTGISRRIFARCDDYERYKLMEYLEFVGDRRPYHQFIIATILAPRPKRFAPVSLLHAPSPKLKGITFAQFIFADTYYGLYQTSQNETDLNKFIAALYLLKDDKFDESIILNRHLYIGRINRATREAIAINWQLIHEWLALAYPLIFQKRDEMITDEPSSEQPSVSKADASPWIKIFRNFVGDDILHNDDYAKMPINTIFAYMTRKYKENARKK
jgi:hypothetical protein